MRNKMINNFLLLLTALIWGSAFVAQSVGMDYIGPFTFNCVRSILGGTVLLPVIWFMDRRKKAGYAGEKKVGYAGETVGAASLEGERKRNTLLTGGVCCGAALAAASSLQQIGLQYTSAGKAGFITALYIVLVPVMGMFIGKKTGLRTWIGIALAAVGLYFLCITDGFSIARGDLIILLCAAVFAVHILLIDYFSPRVDGVRMSCIQFFVTGILCAFPMILSEQPQISGILLSWQPLVYAGVFSSGVAYTLQIIAQKNTDPTVASLLLSLESVFSVIAGWIILGEEMSGRELSGCVLVFAAVVLAQLPSGHSGR